MRLALRTGLTGLVLLGTVITAPSATAAPGDLVTLTCRIHYNSYGTGLTQATAECTYYGTVKALPVSGTARMYLTVSMPSETCPLTQSAIGTVHMSPPFSTSGTIQWARIHNLGVVTISTAPRNYTGTAEFFVVSPVGNPCGGPVEETVIFTLAGA